MEYVDRLALATNSYLQFELFEINSLDMNGNKLTKVIGPPFWNGSLYFANFRTYTIFLLSFTYVQSGMPRYTEDHNTKSRSESEKTHLISYCWKQTPDRGTF